MVNEYEKKYAVQDKQDTLAMCALQIISQSEKFSKSERTSINEINDKLNSINDLVIQSLDS
jgi:cell division protein ZapA